MIIDKNFVAYSFLSEGITAWLLQDNDELNSTDDFFYELILAIVDTGQRHFTWFIKIFSDLNNGNYHEARENFKIRDNYTELNEEIQLRRKELKSLLKGIILAANVIDDQQIIEYRSKVNQLVKRLPINPDKSIKDCYFLNNIFDYKWSNQHLLLLIELEKVNSLLEFKTFKQHFHRIIVELFLELMNIFDTRVQYTINYIIEYPEYEKPFTIFRADFEKFREDIEVQKTFYKHH